MADLQWRLALAMDGMVLSHSQRQRAARLGVRGSRVLGQQPDEQHVGCHQREWRAASRTDIQGCVLRARVAWCESVMFTTARARVTHASPLCPVLVRANASGVVGGCRRRDGDIHVQACAVGQLARAVVVASSGGVDLRRQVPEIVECLGTTVPSRRERVLLLVAVLHPARRGAASCGTRA